jgi:hypothetical protein
MKIKNGIYVRYYLTINVFEFIYFVNEGNNNKIMIMLNEENIPFLEKSKVWVVDATFYVCPKEYKQLFAIYAKILEMFHQNFIYFNAFKVEYSLFNSISIS